MGSTYCEFISTTPTPITSPTTPMGSFTNYVSMFFVFFDPLPPSLAIVCIWLTPPKNYVRFWAPPPPKKKYIKSNEGKKTKNGNIWRNSGKIKKKNAGKIKKNFGKIHKIWGKSEISAKFQQIQIFLDQIMFFFFANVSKWPTPLPPR